MISKDSETISITKEEVIEILKILEGLKKKLQNLLK